MICLHKEAVKKVDQQQTLYQLMASCRSASLSVLEHHTDTIPPITIPYVSLIMVSHSEQMRPLVVLSDLAHHTKLLQQDPKVCLLYDDTQSLASPLTGLRASLYGTIMRIAPDELHRSRAIYLAAHIDAQQYIDFKDFHLYQVIPYQAHLIAGFGDIHWLDLTP